MFCVKCGAKLEENAKFCRACGASVHDKMADVLQTSTNKTRGGTDAVLRGGNVPNGADAAARQDAGAGSGQPLKKDKGIKKHKPFPWSIILVGLVIVLLIGGIGTGGYLLLQKGYLPNPFSGDKPPVDIAEGSWDEESGEASEEEGESDPEEPAGSSTASERVEDYAIPESEEDDDTTEGFDASKYVKGIMDNVYYGDATNYMELVEITKEEAYDEYEGGIGVEADYFVKYYNLEDISGEVYRIIKEMYKEIYKSAKFKVEVAVKNGDDYFVEVVISPISLIVDSEDEIIEKWNELNNKLNPDDYATDREINDEYAIAVISIIKKNMADISYGADKSVIVKVERDADGYYMISDDAMMNLDTEVIAYK